MLSAGGNIMKCIIMLFVIMCFCSGCWGFGGSGHIIQSGAMLLYDISVSEHVEPDEQDY